jgi:small subunit ribosomal protein S4
MGRYTGPSCRLCRRAGEKLFLKGERCFTPRCAVERRRSTPGDQPLRRRRPSDYGIHLLEKQKAKYIYGVLESQFRRYMTEAFNAPGITGLNLLRALERRLDNVIFLLGFAESRKQARQMVMHGHFMVNGKKNGYPFISDKSRRLHSVERVN